jgi:omega-hydroxy-beta-dihydromenaquinone-9 sulfotransferase
LPSSNDSSWLKRFSRRLPALPYPHFMGFAALDCWARMLLGGGAIRRIPARYWPRVAAGLCTSVLGTLATLPERLVLALPLARSRAGARASNRAAGTPKNSAPIVFILGYYRSGTTHLQYLLSCDPQFVTPRWYQVLAPQGFALSWTFLRYFLVPFLSSTRPQDDVAYGPEYPAEDDFAQCNWNAACTMPGRMVLPGEWSNYRRYQTLDGLTPAELRRFRTSLIGFVRKLHWLNPGRAILLKSPAHTARVRELRAMYGDRCRFIHLSRPALPVLRSNVAMHARYGPFVLQPLPGDAEIARRVVEEYDLTERHALADLANTPTEQWARLRYQDLIADPIREVERVYAALGLTLSSHARAQMVSYLETVREYRSAEARERGSSPGPVGPRPLVTLPAELEWMHVAFGHDQPLVPAQSSPVGLPASGAYPPGEPVPRTSAVGSSRAATASLDMTLAALWCVAAWLVIAYFGSSRFDWLAWPVGVVIGLTGLRSAQRGSPAIGVVAVVLTLATIAMTAFPATWLSDYRTREPVPWDHVWLSTRRGMLAWNNMLWVALALLSAYRYATRKHLRPPGL